MKRIIALSMVLVLGGIGFSCKQTQASPGDFATRTPKMRSTPRDHNMNGNMNGNGNMDDDMNMNSNMNSNMEGTPRAK